MVERLKVWRADAEWDDDTEVVRASDYDALQELNTQLGMRSDCVDDLAFLVKRLVHHLDKAAPDHAVSKQAMAYLRRKGLQGNPFRAETEDSCHG